VDPLLDVDLGEALGLLSALRWVRDLQLDIMDFETDSKNVVYSLYVSKSGISNLVTLSSLGDKPTKSLIV